MGGFEVSDKVRVLPPFDGAFPDIYTIESVDVLEGGTVCRLSGVESAFDPCFLEVI